MELSIQVKCESNIYQIPIDFERKKRKNLILKVYPRTARVVFCVPLNTPEQYAREFLQKQMPWLQKQLQKVLPNLNNTTHHYQTGDSFLYLGQKIPLYIINGAKNQAEIIDNKIIVQQKKELTLQQKKLLIDKLFNKQLKEVLEKSLSKNLVLFSDLPTLAKVPVELKIRKMNSKWAVCRPIKNQISFSSNLIQVPLDLIDYVMVHELSHFKHLDHSKLFWQYVEQKMPNWKANREKLKTVAIDT